MASKSCEVLTIDLERENNQYDSGKESRSDELRKSLIRLTTLKCNEEQS